MILLLYGLALGVVAPREAPSHASALYLYEGFDAGALPTGWTSARISGVSAAWTISSTGIHPPQLPFRGQGEIYFNSYTAAAGEQARLTTPRLDLTIAADPFVEFRLYHDGEFAAAADSVVVEYSLQDSVAGPWFTLDGFRRHATTAGWKKEAVSLFAVRGQSRVFVSFRGISRYGNNAFLDEVRVADSTFHDAGVLRVDPQSADGHEGSPFTARTLVVNRGTYTESGYQVGWSIDGQVQQTVNAGTVLQRGAVDTIALLWQIPAAGVHTIRAWSIVAADSNHVNDSASVTVQILDASIVFHEDFNTPTFPPAGWVAVNRDGGMAPPWFHGSPQSAFPPFAGTGFAADNFQAANGFTIDDYLISPGVTGVGSSAVRDSIVFWCRSILNPPPYANPPDSVLLLLSTTGQDTAQFTIPLEYFSVPKTENAWTRKAYDIGSRVAPSSTVSIAFRYLHRAGGISGTSADFIGIDAVSFVRRTSTFIPTGGEVPYGFSISQNYPNPFNPSTTIRFTIPRAARTLVAVTDLLGRTVATLVDDPLLPSGEHSVVWNAAHDATGIYYCTLTSGQLHRTIAMVLVR